LLAAVVVVATQTQQALVAVVLVDTVSLQGSL
jgi:hypothetical protein